MNTYEQLIAKESKTESVPLLLIRTDGGTQYRSNIDDGTVDDYKLAYKDGINLPPLQAVFDGTHYWIYDGFHRLKAMQTLGKSEVPICYLEGTLDDAKLLALTVNAKHGLPRNLATKRAIGIAALQCPALKDRTTYDIAKITGLSSPFIKSLRDPEAKVRQQDARDKSAIKKIKLKVNNPINSKDELVDEDIEDAVPEDVGPTEEEMAKAEQWHFEAQQRVLILIEEDSSLENALAEVERLHVSNKHLEYRLNIVSNERKAMLSTLRREQRKVDR